MEHKSRSERRTVLLRYNMISQWPTLHNSFVPYKWIQWTVLIIRLHSSSLELLGTMADLKRGYERKGNFDRYRTEAERAAFPSAFARSFVRALLTNGCPTKGFPSEFRKSRRLRGSLIKSIITKEGKKLVRSFEDVRGNFRLTNLTSNFASSRYYCTFST